MMAMGGMACARGSLWKGGPHPQPGSFCKLAGGRGVAAVLSTGLGPGVSSLVLWSSEVRSVHVCVLGVKSGLLS